jgi:Uma2 family endonuclease
MITDINQLDFNKQYIYADYLTLNFEERVELIRGWISRMSPAPLKTHQLVSMELSIQIGVFLRGKDCKIFAAPFDIRLINKRKKLDDQAILSVVQPDISVICDLEKLDDRGCLGSPDWIIEILGPGNSRKEMKEKYALYEENGVKEYWIVSPENQFASVYHLIDEKFVLTDTYCNGDNIPVGIFDGFYIDSEKMFA